MADSPALAPVPDLGPLLAARRMWVRKHAAVALVCLGTVVLLADLLLVGLRHGLGRSHLGAVVLDGALIGVLVSLAFGATANAWSAWRFAARIDSGAVQVPCRITRLAPQTRMRKDYLQLSVGGARVLVRCAEDAPTHLLSEVVEGSVLGWPVRRGGIVLLLPHVGPMAATVGRYHRHLPKEHRAAFLAARTVSD